MHKKTARGNGLKTLAATVVVVVCARLELTTT
jgi:hypothetical protein